jgi:DNA-binding transcriptional ArsR family regulator
MKRDKLAGRVRHRDAELPGIDVLYFPAFSSISRNVWSQRPPGGLRAASSCHQADTLPWRQIPMAPAIITMKKATKTSLADKEALLRTKSYQLVANLLKQVGHPTRLEVLFILSESEQHVGGLCDQFNLSQPAVSHHLTLLRHGGVVERCRRGQNNFYSLTETGHRLSKIVKGMIG